MLLEEITGKMATYSETHTKYKKLMQKVLMLK
jgi:hypothetical protein